VPKGTPEQAKAKRIKELTRQIKDAESQYEFERSHCQMAAYNVKKLKGLLPDQEGMVQFSREADTKAIAEAEKGLLEMRESASKLHDQIASMRRELKTLDPNDKLFQSHQSHRTAGKAKHKANIAMTEGAPSVKTHAPKSHAQHSLFHRHPTNRGR
jgi:hypothetical protein